MKNEKYAEAVEEFRASLQYKADSGHATAAKIQMANSLRLQGKPREAIAVLQRLMEEHLDRELSDDAYWFLALSHEDAHQKDEARSVLRSLMRQFPDSQYYRAARIRQAELQLHLYSSGSGD
jgi:TolA-binding protein